MTTRPSLLYLGHNLPFPPHEGALIRSFHTVRLLSESFDVSAIYFYRRSALPLESDRERALAEMRRFGPAQAFPIAQEWSPTRLVADHVRSLATRTPYTRWAHASRAARSAIRDHLSASDVRLVHVDSLDLMAFLPEFDQVPFSLAHHNVESQLLSRRAQSETGLKRAYIHHQAGLVAKAERHWCTRAAVNLVVSPEDAHTLKKLSPKGEFLVVPNGVDTDAFRPRRAAPAGEILFVGGHSWFPNSDGMAYFTREILPLIRAQRPGVTVKWIGRAPSAVVEEYRQLGVEMLGYVDDIRKETHDARCVIVPLRVGGGTRLKILDAWAMGKAVVSTTRGCEGLRTEHGVNILIADKPRDFADAALETLQDSDLRQRLEINGRRTAVDHYDWGAIGDLTTSRYLELHQHAGGAPSSPRQALD